MLRTISAALLAALSMVAVVAPGCTSEKACAYGPSELRDVSLSVSAGAPINGTIDYGDINGSEFTAVSAYDAPAGVQLSLFDSGVKVDGSVATAGTYGFEVLVEAEEGNVCAPWARYDVTLTVK